MSELHHLLITFAALPQSLQLVWCNATPRFPARRWDAIYTVGQKNRTVLFFAATCPVYGRKLRGNSHGNLS